MMTSAELSGRLFQLIAGQSGEAALTRRIVLQLYYAGGRARLAYVAVGTGIPSPTVEAVARNSTVLLFDGETITLSILLRERLGLPTGEPFPDEEPVLDPFARERGLLARCTNVSSIEEHRAWLRARTLDADEPIGLGAAAVLPRDCDGLGEAS